MRRVFGLFQGGRELLLIFSELEDELGGLPECRGAIVVLPLFAFLSSLVVFYWRLLENGGKLGGERYPVRPQVPIQHLQGLQESRGRLKVLEEIGEESDPDAFFFQETDNLADSLSFCGAAPLHRVATGYVFIHPHFAFLIFVDHDHLAADLERAEFLKEARESGEALV